MKKLFFITLGLGFVFLSGVCLESAIYAERGYKKPWIFMTPPIASLYITVPGFFSSLISAFVSFDHVL